MRMVMKRWIAAAMCAVALSCDGSPTDSGEKPVPSQIHPARPTVFSAAAGSTVEPSIRVRVIDSKGKAVAGVSVAWSVTSGGGRVSAATAVTDAAGEAGTEWTLGHARGTQTLAASVDSLAPLVFTATAMPVATRLEKGTGDAQSGRVGRALAEGLTVRVLDGAGVPLAGTEVTWTVTQGGGEVVSPRGVSDSAGVVRTQWKLGSTTGAQAVEARATGLTGSPVAFMATATPVVVASLARVGGDAQTGAAGTDLASPLRVRALEEDGTPVAGVSVTWTAGSGSIRPLIVPTDSQGYANATWTLGTRVGSQAATASGAGFSTPFSAIARPGAAASLVRISGDGQAGAPGRTLPTALSVRVSDAHGNAVPGATVQWRVVTGGGTVSTASSTADSAGVAHASWTLGSAPGGHSAEASLPGGVSVSFSATATPVVVGSVRITAGDGQSGPVGSALPVLLRVTVSDSSGSPVAGFLVAWAVESGGGTVSAASVATDSSGAASVTWTLGTRAGEGVVIARAGDRSARFTSTASALAAARIAVVSGDGQSSIVGSPLADSLVVRVTDVHGNAVSGTRVDWVVAGGGGSVGRASSVSQVDGLAKTAWTLGSTVGAQTVEARADGLSGSPVVFRATGSTPPSQTLSIVSGDQQTGTVAAALGAPLVVKVVNEAGLPVVGAAIAWSVTGGGGSVSSGSTATGSDGQATVTWTLGTVAGAQTARAAFASQAVTFTATGTPAAASTLVKDQGDGQTANRGTTLPSALRVRLNDAHGNAVSGAAVQWTVSSGGGSLSAASSTTGADGTAQATWTLGGSTGTQQVQVTVGSLSATFTATATISTAGRALVKVSGDNQTGTVNADLAAPLVVRLVDVAGLPVPGDTVRWALESGSGTLTASSVTNENGEASATLRLGTAAGARTVRASHGSASATFTATGTPAAASSLVKEQGDGQTADQGTTLPTALRVRLSDAYGNVIGGAAVQWTVSSGGGSLSAASSTTGADGTAQATWTLGSATGTQQVQATAGGLSVTFAATARVSTAGRTLTKVSGDNQTVEINQDMPSSVVIRLRNSDGTPVQGDTITWTATGLSSFSHLIITNANGEAWATGRADGTPGTRTIRAAWKTLSIDFTLNVVHLSGIPATVTLAAGNNQSAPAGAALADSLAVRVLDAYGQPVNGASVAWSTPSGGTLSAATTTTNSTGYARVRWTLGSAEGSQTARATVGSLSPVAFTATALPPAVHSVTVSPAAGTELQSGSTLQLTATLKDASGNVLTGRTVTWSSADTLRARVNSSGVAVGLQYGFVTLRATSEGVTGSTVLSIQDTQAPTLISLGRSPATVTVASDTGSVLFSVAAADSGTVYRANVRFGPSPSGYWGGGNCSTVGGASPVSGTVRRGTWTCKKDFHTQAYAGGVLNEVGTYNIQDVQLYDERGNLTTVTAAQLQAAGHPTSFTISNPADVTPASLTGFTLTPDSLSAASGGTLSASVSLSDASGISIVRIGIVAPTINSDLPTTMISGTSTAGTWRSQLSIPAGSPAGEATVLFLYVVDKGGNARKYSTAELQALGYPTKIPIK